MGSETSDEVDEDCFGTTGVDSASAGRQQQTSRPSHPPPAPPLPPPLSGTRRAAPENPAQQCTVMRSPSASNTLIDIADVPGLFTVTWFPATPSAIPSSTASAIDLDLTDRTVQVLSDLAAAAFAITITFLLNWRLAFLLIVIVVLFVVNYRLNIEHKIQLFVYARYSPALLTLPHFMSSK